MASSERKSLQRICFHLIRSPRVLRLGTPWLLGLVLASSVAAGEESDEQRFLAGLRQRGLFQLAQTYCLDRLQRADLSSGQRADLVIELSRCLAERALSSPPGERAPLWERATGVIDEFAARNPQNPRLPLLRFQQALGLLSRGELARQEAALVADGRPLLEEARVQLRAAIRGLRRLNEETEQRLREQNLSAEQLPDELTSDQLASLQKNVQYELARALRNQGLCYAGDSPDRANSLTQAVQLLEPLAGLDPANPLAWKSRLDLIRSHRLLHDGATARRQLEALLAFEQLPPEVRLRARAEQIRLALVAGKLPEAIAVLSRGREIEGAVSPDLDYAWLETYLAAWAEARRATQPEEADRWQAKATELVRVMETLHGPYWMRRAEMLLASYVRSAPETGDLAMLVRAAESSFRSGRFDDALAGYDRARAVAARQDDADRAFELGYVAATVEHQRGRHEQALSRYRQIALATPQHAKAAEAHLLAIYHAGQIAKQQARPPLDQYLGLLEEHLQTWPDGPTSDEVRRRLGRLHEHRADWQGALAAYRAISPDVADYLEVVRAAERCYLAWLSESASAGTPTQPIASEAAAWFESLVLGSRGNPPERWSPVERLAVLAAARIRMDHTADGHARAHLLLSEAIEASPDAPPEWTSAAEALLVCSLAGQGRHREAREALAKTSSGSPAQLLAMLEGLGRVAATARPKIRAELAELQLRAIEMLRAAPSRLTPAQRQRLEKVRAGALAAAGRTEEALAAHEALAAAYPRDGAVQEAYAELLLSQEDLSSVKKALEAWRRLEQKSRPRSRRWFLAKYSVAKAHCLLGNKQHAARIVTQLQLLHPELGGAEMKQKLLELLDRCRP